MNTLTSVPTKSGQIFYVVMQKRRDGEIHLARTLLEQIGEKFEYPCMSEEE